VTAITVLKQEDCACGFGVIICNDLSYGLVNNQDFSVELSVNNMYRIIKDLIDSLATSLIYMHVYADHRDSLCSPDNIQNRFSKVQ
jgi:hypothetical protein